MLFVSKCLCWLTIAITAVCSQVPSDGDLRLTESEEVGKGRLEVFFNGTWGTVCDDGFGPEEAGVACWQLGFSRHGNNYSTIGVDSTNPPFLLDDLHCQGNENRLEECQHRPWGWTDCKSVEHVALGCNVDLCEHSPCLNGGTCMTVHDVNVTCLCTPITTGDHCEDFIDLCEEQNGGCSHGCVSQQGNLECTCPENLQLTRADGRTCYAPTVDVQCGRTMDVAFPRTYWPGLHEQYLTLSDSSCAVSGNSTHVTVSVPLDTCGTTSQILSDGFIFENQIVSHNVPLAGLVSRVREINMTVRCHYDNDLYLENSYIVNNDQMRFSDMAQGHYQLSMDLFHNGQQYVGGPLDRLVPGEDLSIRLSLSSNDSSLQVFAHNCRATPIDQHDYASQFLMLNNGCSSPSVEDNRPNNTQETLQLQAFQFLSENSSTVLMHCDVIVCNVNDPTNRCSRGCLTGGDASPRGAAPGAGEKARGRERRDVKFGQTQPVETFSANAGVSRTAITVAVWLCALLVSISTL